MDSLISTVAKVAKVKIRNDDDLCDRLNHRYTTLLLMIFTIVVSTTQYVGNPIHCWCPAYFTSNHEEFTNKICWISNTYSVPIYEDIPAANEPRHEIGYYQWVPIVLLVQALCFYLPCMVWRVFSDRSGINMNNLVEAAETIQNALYPERRDKTIKYMTRHLDHYLDYQKEYREGCCVSMRHFMAKYCYLVCGNRYGNYLVALYMTVKFLYFVNVIGQLFLLNAFLGTEYHLYGIDVIKDLAQGNDWSASKRFPRVTLCDFSIRQLGNIHRHTVQCVLPINLFNEKIYIFLWFWFVFLATSTALSWATWFYQVVVRYSRSFYIRKYLKIMDKINKNSDRDRKLCHKFVERYLRQDGIFVLRLIAKNATDIVTAEIVCALWENFKSKPSNLRGLEETNA